MSVTVKILFFAKSREIVGQTSASLELPTHISYVDLLQKIVEEFSLNDIKHSVILSLNEEFCHSEDTINLKNGDEIAVIPPLSGG
ncbi:molybdopterin synthase sulfur carrier subunit [Zophobas morio]|uniref:molybdopterin synthase sulfur carrier subunit n=1 Tax=Zophobas morio TaxID=2755281 RepID=UPI003082C877